MLFRSHSGLLEQVISATSQHGLPGFFLAYLLTYLLRLTPLLVDSSITSYFRLLPLWIYIAPVYSLFVSSILSVFRISRQLVAIILVFVAHAPFSPYVTSDSQEWFPEPEGRSGLMPSVMAYAKPHIEKTQGLWVGQSNVFGWPDSGVRTVRWLYRR